MPFVCAVDGCRFIERGVYKLFDAVTVKKVDGVAVPRKFSDYTVTVSEDLPEGVTCERLS